MSTNLLAQHISTIVEKYIKRYNTLIYQEFGLNDCELEPLWEQVEREQLNASPVVMHVARDSCYVLNQKTPVSSPVVKTCSSISSSSSSPSTPPKTFSKTRSPPGAPKKKKKSEKKSEKKSDSPQPSRKILHSPISEKKKVTGCPYVYTKGAKEGLRCGCKPKGGNTYCSRHKKYEGQVPNTKKVLPPARRSIVSNKRKNPTKKHPEIVLHKGPNGKHYHRPTGLVFGSDKVAIGTWLRAGDNPKGVDEIVTLTDKDIEVAKKHMFAFRREEETEQVIEATRKVTRLLEPDSAKQFQESLSDAIASTNEKAQDVAAILSELQTRRTSSEEEEEIGDESEYEEEELLEEED